MPRKGQPAPSLDVLDQWAREAAREAAQAISARPIAGHPVIRRAIEQAARDGYLQGRLAEWRKQQELSALQQSLDAGMPD